MSLQPFRVFRKHLSQHLMRVKSDYRRPLLTAIYRLAKKKIGLENSREHAEKQVHEIRASRLHHERVRAHIENALQSLHKAERASDDPELLVNLDIQEARRLLRMAAADLRWIVQLFAAMVHPHLRTRQEKATALTLDRELFPQIPGFRPSAIDYWFIAELEKCFVGCATSSDLPLRRVDYDRIISEVFKAAFGEAYEVDRVKTARRRLAERRYVKSQQSIQN